MDPNVIGGGWKPLNRRFGDVVRERGNPDQITQAAADTLKQLEDQIPQSYGYDFMPAIRAFIESSVTLELKDGGRTFIRPMVNVAPLVATVQGSTLVPKSVATLNKHFINPADIDKTGTVPKQPGRPGEWKYVWYIPEWTHPDFDPSISVSYNKPGQVWYGRDPISAMYPALRVEDVIKNPTDWAKRFGIHPDELGGRSRLSPTLSKTRDPFQDYANQINLLSDEGRRQAVEGSREKARQLGEGPGYIAPEVLEAILTQEGRLSAKQFREELEKNLGPERNQKMNFDAFIEAVNAREPLVYDAHSNFLANALADQDFQRLMFGQMTSDDLMWDNIFTMSNNVQYDLTGDIHHLFKRQRWDDSRAKGVQRHLPRLLYNINGQRKEWDATTNDELWTALQPALMLVTKVLDSRPAGLRRIYDMNNRRKLPVHLDNRDLKLIPRAPVYGVDGVKAGYDRYPELERLAELGFDWEANINRVLNDHMCLDIGTGFISPMRSMAAEAVDGAKESDECPYGLSCYWEEGQTISFTITLSAEAVWPLLVPQFSQSEKMVTSFGVAATLLHEFGHAISMATQILTQSPQGPAPGTSPEVRALLTQLGEQLWDIEMTNEPVLVGQGSTELGFDFEASVFGCVAFNLLANPNTKHARQLQNIPLVLAGHQYPSRMDPGCQGMVADAKYPVENYYTPMAIDWIGNFFRQGFWDQFVGRLGLEALKMRPSSRLLKTVMSSDFVSLKDLEDAYGRDEANFLSFCTALFQMNRDALTGEYIQALTKQPVLLRTTMQRWSLEIKHWHDDVLAPLERSAQRMTTTIMNAERLNTECNTRSRNLQAYYDAYVQKHTTQTPPLIHPPKTMDEWINDMKRVWNQMFRTGGTLMRTVLETHNYMIQDVARCQRMVFDFFSFNPEARSQVYNGFGSGDKGLIGHVYGRMLRYRSIAKRVTQALHDISNLKPLESQKHNWQIWERIYRQSDELYGDLLGMLGNREQYYPGDIQWKRRFATVPSSCWKSRLDGLRTMMQKEYVKMDPRLRGLVDECENIVRRFRGAEGMAGPLELNETQVETVTTVLNQMRNLGNQLPIESIGPFQWTAPPAATPAEMRGQSPAAPAAPRPPPTQPQQNTFSGAVFGQPSQIPGAPPVRSQASTNPAPNPFSNTQGTSPFTGLAAGSRPNPFGSGGSFPTTGDDQTAFRRRPDDTAATPQIFANPYATSVTTTEDLQYFQALRDETVAAQMLMNLQSSADRAPYDTNEQWRDSQSMRGESPQPPRAATLPQELDAINANLDGMNVDLVDLNAMDTELDFPYGLPEWQLQDTEPDSVFDELMKDFVFDDLLKDVSDAVQQT